MIPQKDKFLYRLAQDLLNRYGTDLQHVAVVFNNKRPQLFLRKYLAEISGKPIFSPKLYTIQTFFAEASTLVAATPLKQFFVLYEEYRKLIKPAESEELNVEKFYPLAETILADFSAIDYYLADAEKVFNSIGDHAEIAQQFPNFDEEQLKFMESFWLSFSGEKQNAIQQKFIELWRIMPQLYKNFHQQLRSQNLTTNAGMYRNLANNIDCDPNFINRFSHTVFAGFNALSKAEEKLFKTWQDNGQCSFYFDADEHYFNDHLNEAGHFIRRNINSIGLRNEFEIGTDKVNNPKKDFTIIQATGNIAQGKLLASIIDEQSTTEKVIILADESLLIPVLQTLHQDDLNVTMGYPFEQSTVFGLCDLWLNIQQDIISRKGKNIGFQLVIDILSNPLLKFNEPLQAEIKNRIIDHKLTELSIIEFVGLNEYFGLIFSNSGSLFNSIEQLSALLSAVAQSVGEGQQMEQLLISEALKALNFLKEGFENLDLKERSLLNGTLIFKFIKRALQGLTVAFEGEPLVGLQVMGLLESRCLDFEEVIVLGMNEGILPKVSKTPTFIPDNVRRAFGLPVLENQNAIFAYFFYRLLHGAKKVTLVYNGLTDETSSGEESRFIKQLRFETRCKFSDKIQQNKASESYFSKSITVKKEGEVLTQMRKFFIRGSNAKYDKKISATAFTEYLACPLQFFFRRIARLKEQESLPGIIEASDIGSMLHHVLENFYCDALRKTVDENYIKTNKTKLPSLCKDALATILHQKSAKEITHFSAIEQIVLSVLEQYALKVLAHDLEIVPFQINELENREDYQLLFPININEKSGSVWLSGIIDRVDIHQGKTRIVDYKTGKDVVIFKDFDSLFAQEKKNQNKALVQTLFYTFIYEQVKNVSGVEPHLYTIKSFDENTLFKNKKGNNGLILTDENLATFKLDFKHKMQEVLEHLFNPDIPFEQTTDLKTCEYCPYKAICQR